MPPETPPSGGSDAPPRAESSRDEGAADAPSSDPHRPAPTSARSSATNERDAAELAAPEGEHRPRDEREAAEPAPVDPRSLPLPRRGRVVAKEERAVPETDAPDLSKAPKLGRRPVLIFAGAALGLYALFGPKLPREQRLRVPLGSARASAREARIAWWSTGGEPLREASFSFAPGEAPEALIHELRLPDGDYDVDVEIVLMEGRTASRKRVTVSGATTTLDVSFRP